jgi:hypothetical protein
MLEKCRFSGQPRHCERLLALLDPLRCRCALVVEAYHRPGRADDAHKIHDLFLSGKRQEAVAAVPDALVDELSRVGPAERIRERATAWKASKATMLLLGGDSNAIKVAAEAFL